MGNRGAFSTTGPQRITAAQRGDQAVRLRVAGLTLDEIAQQLGYSNRGAVSKAVTAALKRQGKPAAEELAAIHMERLEVAAKRIMARLNIESQGKLSVGALSKATLSLTRVLAAEAKYVDVYSQSQGLGPVTSLLEQLLSSPPAGTDPDDPMTVPVQAPESIE